MLMAAARKLGDKEPARQISTDAGPKQFSESDSDVTKVCGLGPPISVISFPRGLLVGLFFQQTSHPHSCSEQMTWQMLNSVAPGAVVETHIDASHAAWPSRSDREMNWHPHAPNQRMRRVGTYA